MCIPIIPCPVDFILSSHLHYLHSAVLTTLLKLLNSLELSRKLLQRTIQSVRHAIAMISACMHACMVCVHGSFAGEWSCGTSVTAIGLSSLVQCVYVYHKS